MSVTKGTFYLAEDEERVLCGGRYGDGDPEVVANFAVNDIMAVQDPAEQTANACLFAASKHFRQAVAGYVALYMGETLRQGTPAYLPPELATWVRATLAGDPASPGWHLEEAIRIEQGLAPR